MKKLTLVTLIAAVGAAAIGCSSTAGTNANTKANMTTANSNTAVVVNSNQAPITNTGAHTTSTSNSNLYNSTMTRADYEKNNAAYSADQAASSIGQGADDKWIWFKAKAALASVNDLRDSTVNVDVANSVITLKGTVATAAQKTAAETAAKGIEGQKGVKNELKVNANDSLTNQTVGTGAAATDGEHKGTANANHK